MMKHCHTSNLKIKSEDSFEDIAEDLIDFDF
jgi:hypothetical protein